MRAEWIVAVFACFLGVTAATHAGGALDPTVEAIEALKEAQGADAAFIGRYFGPDGGSPITFLSSIDPEGRQYSYQSAPGSTYLGMPITLGASGAFNQSDGMWHTTSTGMLGDLSWAQTGDGMFNADIGRDVAGPETLPRNWWANSGVMIGGTLFDLHAHITYGPDAGGFPISFGTLRFTIDGATVATVTASDRLLPDCTWIWNMGSVQVQGVNFRVESSGGFVEGDGSFVMQIDIPSPPAACLIVGCAITTRHRRRRE